MGSLSPRKISIFIGGMVTIPRKMGGKNDIVLPTLAGLLGIVVTHGRETF